MKRCVLLVITALAFLSHAVSKDVTSNNKKAHIDLNVAIFAYLPDASTAIKKIEEIFELQHDTIDLDLELWNPYVDKSEDDGLEQISKFDVIEIDACRIDQLIDGAFGSLDVIPAEMRGSPNDYVRGARTLASTKAGKYIVPHWVCGNFLVIWSGNTDVVNAESFDAFLKAIDPSAGKPLLAGMWGSIGIGELYTDAMIDIYGQEKAKTHLINLDRDAGGSVRLDSEALSAVVQLANELTPLNRSNLSHFYNHSYVFPRQFASSPNAVLLGYSERLYYTERELQLIPGLYPPILKSDSVVVRQFSFSSKSRGTPSWIDGFVIPKGRLSKKKAAIHAFLEFIRSNDAYIAFAEPTPYLAPTYLLPAKLSAYKDETLVKKQPLLTKFLEKLDGSFPVIQYDLWQGMRAVGNRIKKYLKKD